jgi:hypothetical protein
MFFNVEHASLVRVSINNNQKKLFCFGHEGFNDGVNIMLIGGLIQGILTEGEDSVQLTSSLR